MKSRFAVGVMILTGLATLLSACGGGGGGPATTSIKVTAAKNPVLIGGSTTITAIFANYTSTIKFGSTVNFTVSTPGVLTSATKTQAGGIATVSVTSPQATTVTVSASSGNFAGSTNVAFIPQPASVSLIVMPKQAINNLGALSFDISSDIPATFSSYSTTKASGTFSITNPNVFPTFNISTITASLVAVAGVNVSSISPLFKFTYATPSVGVPIFTANQAGVLAAFSNNTTIKPVPVLNVSPTYYDGTGKVLFP